MNVYRNPDLELSYIDRIKQYLLGEIELPASKLNTRPSGIHQSNLNDHSCILKGYYSSVASNQVEIANDSALRFLYGRAIERVIAFSGELDPILKDDIWVTPDDLHPVYGLTEIKSTTMSSYTDINRKNRNWVCQLRNECVAYGVNKVNLVAFFIAGSMAHWTYFGGHERPEGATYEGVALKAWTYEFTDMELDDHWAVILGRRDILIEAIESKTPVDKEIVMLELPYNWKEKREKKKVVKRWKDYWQCKKCDWSEHCTLFEELVIGV